MASPKSSPKSKAKAKPESKRGKKNAPAPEEILGYYRDMLLIRRFEEKAGQLYGMEMSGQV